MLDDLHSRPLSLVRPEVDAGRWWSLLWRWGEWRRSDLCLGEPQSLELEWRSLRRSSSLERWWWRSVPVLDVPSDFDGRTTFDCTPPEWSPVADLSDFDFDLWRVVLSDLRLFFSFGPKTPSGAWISMLSSMASCSFLAAEAAFLFSFCDLAFSWVSQFSGSHVSHTARCLSGAFMPALVEATLLTTLMVIPSSPKVRALTKFQCGF